MRLLIKRIILYLLYLKAKVKYYNKVNFNGFTIIYRHKYSNIIFDDGGGIVINSSVYSNLVGITQPTIISCRNGGSIKIGQKVGISGSTIYSMCQITIGNNTIIGSGCKIIDNDFHPIDYKKRKKQKDQDIERAPIIIGENCFIGMNSIILKGTELGSNCIVGAGSVVHGKFSDGVVIAGNPAKIIKYLK